MTAVRPYDSATCTTAPLTPRALQGWAFAPLQA